MLYIKKIPIEDRYILDQKSDAEIARLMNCDPSYISLLRHKKRYASEAFYQRLVKVLTNL